MTPCRIHVSVAYFLFFKNLLLIFSSVHYYWRLKAQKRVHDSKGEKAMNGPLILRDFFKDKGYKILKLLMISLLVIISVPSFLGSGCQGPVRTSALQARLELAAGQVMVDQGGQKQAAFSETALLKDASVETGKGSRALVRLSNGSAIFMRSDSVVKLGSDDITLIRGELWLDAPQTERQSLVLRVGKSHIHAVDTGLSVKEKSDGVKVYVARGAATITAPGGRVEVQAGEQATVSGSDPPSVEPVAFWEDWTGGMADNRVVGSLAGSGTGRIYGVDLSAPEGSRAQELEISRQVVHAVIRSGLAETEVDQTFFNPSERPVEGWYWFTLPPDASVTGFAVETNGELVEGEFIERKQAAGQYHAAVSGSHAPALLEWIDSRTFRARIFPVPAVGTRRVVLRYLQLLPVVDGVLRYLYPLQSPKPVQIGEFSLSVDLGEAGTHMHITTLADATIEAGGRLVSMRRSGYVPLADFLLEAKAEDPPEPIRAVRASTDSDTADYVMIRYAPDLDWSKSGNTNGEVVVVVDTSAASDSTSRSVKAAAAEAILRALSANDKFALVSLDVKPTVLHPAEGLAQATDEQITIALENLADHSSGGATDLSALFDVSLARLHGSQQPAVIYIGDGIATSGELNGDKLVGRLRHALATSRARLFTVGVGPNSNKAILSMLAQAGGGRSFQIDTSSQATQRAMDLVAALKTPTLTDFEIDLGAGLDEVISNANGKVTNGQELVILARSHHDLPSEIKVKGRLGSEVFERSYPVAEDDQALAPFVPRLWAWAEVKQLLGQDKTTGAVRGKVMKMGIEYGLVTPFTSILALESEQAYRQQGILRIRSGLRGPRLGALTNRQASGALGIAQAVGYGCAKYEAGESSPVASSPVVQRETKQKVMEYTHRNLGNIGGKKFASIPTKPADPEALKGRPKMSPLPAGIPLKKESGQGLASPTKGEQLLDRAKKHSRYRTPEFRKTCSDAARRPLRQRVVLWKKRIQTAKSPQDLVHRYQAAWYACELPDWRSEATFLRVLQPAIKNEGAASYVLEFFRTRPDVQRYLARLILRRTVDKRIIKVVERILFKGKINWATVDIELSELPSPEVRLAHLRSILNDSPNDPNGTIRLVHLLVKTKRIEEALSVCRKLRDEGLATPFLVRELGDLLSDHKLEEEAVRTYSEIVEFDPKSLASRRLLGDIYLAHGWYSQAYLQYKTLVENKPDEPLFQLRLANAAAGAGRVDEALRIERSVIRAPGRPGPKDTRLWAKLWSAARLSVMLANPPKNAPRNITKSIKSKLKELQLFRGPSTLVMLTWEDLGCDVELDSATATEPDTLGEKIDASRVGLSAVLISGNGKGRPELSANLRSPTRDKPIKLLRHDITWTGKDFQVSTTKHIIEPGQSGVSL